MSVVANHKFYGASAHMIDHRRFYFDPVDGTGQASIWKKLGSDEVDREWAIAHLKGLYAAIRGELGFDLVDWAIQQKHARWRAWLESATL